MQLRYRLGVGRFAQIFRKHIYMCEKLKFHMKCIFIKAEPHFSPTV